MFPLRAGSSLGKYTLLKELGRGGMGVVYLAEDTTLGRRIALKLLHPSLSRDDEFQTRFNVEARSIAAIAHPHVVHLNAFSRIDDVLAIETEYLDGGSLFDRMHSAGMTATEVIHIAGAVLDALAYCHGLGIIHRDVKPSNILFDHHGTAKLSDFGLAKTYSEVMLQSIRRSTSSLFMGTPQYAPPEAWEDAEPTPAWDVYSVGVIMYELLTGSPPYEGGSALSVLKQILSSPIPSVRERRPDISSAFAELVSSMLEADSGKRLADADAALARLHEVPENSALAEASARTVVQRRRRNRELSRPHRRFNGSLRLRWVLGIFLISLAAAAIGGMVAPLETLWGRHASGTGSATRRGEAFGAPQYLLAGADDVLNRGRDRLSVYNAEIHGDSSGDTHRWVLESAEAGKPFQVWGSLSSVIVHLTLSPIDDAHYSIEGGWSGYRDSAGSMFGYGPVSGTARWTDRGNLLVSAMTFASEQTGARWTHTVVATRDGSGYAVGRAIYELERSDIVQPLLFRELLPRSIAWADAFERLFPSIEQDRILVPVVDLEPDLTIDGALTEPVWQDVHSDSDGVIGVLRARPRASGTSLVIRSLPQGLCVGIRSSAPAPRETLRIDLALLTQFTMPVSESEIWLVGIEGGRIVQQHRAAYGKPLPWGPEWQLATRSGDGEWEMELLVPFDDASHRQPPGHGDRWRLNCCVYTRDASGTESPWLQWGFPEVDAACHGTILQFIDVSDSVQGETGRV